MNKCLNFLWLLCTGCRNIDGAGMKHKMKFTLSNKSKFLVNARQAEAGANNLQRPQVRELYD